MEKEPTTIIHARVSQTTFAEICSDINGSKKSMSDWLKEAVEEKLTDENKDSLDREIKLREEELEALKNRREIFKEKEKTFVKIPEREISFLLESKKIIDKDFTYLQGRINLYKNKFHKSYRISEQEFVELLNLTQNQSQEKQIFEQEIRQ